MEPKSPQEALSGRASLPRRNDPRRRRIHISIWWGRLWLVLTFGALLATYYAAIYHMPMNKTNMTWVKVGCGIAILWQSLLFIGVWMRLNWSRLIWIFLLTGAVLVFAAVVPILHLQRPRNPKVFLDKVSACVAVHVGALAMLLACKPIKKLTNRSYQ